MAAPAVTIHRSCRRSTPRARRKRTPIETIPVRRSTNVRRIETCSSAPATPPRASTPSGLATRSSSQSEKTPGRTTAARSSAARRMIAAPAMRQRGDASLPFGSSSSVVTRQRKKALKSSELTSANAPASVAGIGLEGGVDDAVGSERRRRGPARSRASATRSAGTAGALRSAHPRSRTATRARGTRRTSNTSPPATRSRTSAIARNTGASAKRTHASGDRLIAPPRAATPRHGPAASSRRRRRGGRARTLRGRPVRAAVPRSLRASRCAS